MADSAERLIEYCRQNERVCPNPLLWNDLWEMLPDRTQSGGGWQPSPPLILAAWHYTSALEKQLRLAEHIRWAAEHGGLDPVDTFLRGLREQDWTHLSEH